MPPPERSDVSVVDTIFDETTFRDAPEPLTNAPALSTKISTSVPLDGSAGSRLGSARRGYAGWRHRNGGNRRPVGTRERSRSRGIRVSNATAAPSVASRTFAQVPSSWIFRSHDGRSDP